MTAVFSNQGLGQLGGPSLSCSRLDADQPDLHYDVYLFTVAAIVAICCVSGWENSLRHSCDATGLDCSTISFPPYHAAQDLDRMWRLIIGLGCVPGAIALYFRLTIPETPRFTMDVIRNVQQAELDADNFLSSGTYYVDPDAPIIRANARKASPQDFQGYFMDWQNLKTLVGTSYSWFALDVSTIPASSISLVLISDVIVANRLHSTVLG